MGKVITSKGMQDFVQNGTVENVPNHKTVKGNEAPPLEVKADKPIADLSAPGESKPAPIEDNHVDEDAETQAEIDRSERFRKTINKKHRAMKEAQEAAKEAEEFARNQWNEARLAKERASELERRLQEQVKQPAKAAEPELSKPDPKLFYDDKGQFKAFEYAEALATYAAGEAVAKDRAKQVEERRSQEAAVAEAQARKQVDLARKAHSDYDEVMSAVDVKTHPQVLQYMTGSEQIGEIAYYMAKNPDFVERINKLNPLKAIAEIGKLELTFEKPKQAEPAPVVAPKAAGVPPPITPLQTSSSGIVQTDPAKMTVQELRAYERAREVAKRRR